MAKLKSLALGLGLALAVAGMPTLAQAQHHMGGSMGGGHAQGQSWGGSGGSWHGGSGWHGSSGWSGGHWHGGCCGWGWGWGWGWGLGFGLGWGWGWPAAYWGYPYYPYYAYPYYPYGGYPAYSAYPGYAPGYADQGYGAQGYAAQGYANAPDNSAYATPQVQPAPQAGEPRMGYWYYCEDPKGFYPYVPSCKSAWHEVPAIPPPPPGQNLPSLRKNS